MNASYPLGVYSRTENPNSMCLRIKHCASLKVTGIFSMHAGFAGLFRFPLGASNCQKYRLASRQGTKRKIKQEENSWGWLDFYLHLGISHLPQLRWGDSVESQHWGGRKMVGGWRGKAMPQDVKAPLSFASSAFILETKTTTWIKRQTKWGGQRKEIP